ncbi:hypothetical protein UNDYM_3961 [Undibacterium sp. YM2]|nr:hypothetical protein UNDYM_3961 [Undibacterium sp. YM2]
MTTIISSEADNMRYNLPLSGGDETSCKPRNTDTLPLPAQTLAVIQHTALFGICLNVKPVPKAVLACRDEQVEKIYQQALEFEQQLKLVQAHDYYEAVCNARGSKINNSDNSNSQSGKKDPCETSQRLYTKTQKTYDAVIAALENVKSGTGQYPDKLDSIRGDLSPVMQELAQDFVYCKKTRPGDRTAPCSDGGESFSDHEITVDTGLHRARPALEQKLAIPQFLHCVAAGTSKQ